MHILQNCYIIFLLITETISGKGLFIMAEIIKTACAGTDEKSDVVVEVSPCADGVVLELQSVVANQFGASIESSVREVVAQLGVTNVYIKASDRGALDCVLRARVETALRRGMGEN